MTMRTRRPGRNAPKTDLQARVRLIEETADKIRQEAGADRVPSDKDDPVARLAYCVSYLARIVEKHLCDGEN